MIEAPAPLFLHSLFRTGGTYFWNKLRSSPDYYCYYEPFHELLGIHQPGKQATDVAEQARRLRHPDVGKPYLDEYPAGAQAGVPLFQKRFSYDDFCLDEHSDHPALKAYLDSLLRYAPARAVFKFCRSSLRVRWLRRHFDAVHLYVLRHPRMQWESYLSANREYFCATSLMILGKNHGAPLLEPFQRLAYVPCYHSESIWEEFDFYVPLLRFYEPEQQYALTYAIWLVSLTEMMVAADAVVDMDLMTSDPQARARTESLLSEYGIVMDLGDCRLPAYDHMSLGAGVMEEIEQRVQTVFCRHLRSRYPDAQAGIRRHSLQLAPCHRRLLEDLFAGPADRVAVGPVRPDTVRPADALITMLWRSYLGAADGDPAPEDEAIHARALDCEKRELYAEAQALLRPLVTRNPHRAAYSHTLAYACERAGHLEDAARYYEQSAQLYGRRPEAWHARFRQAFVLEQRGDPERAARLYEQNACDARDVVRVYFDSLFRQGQCLEVLGRMEQAGAVYETLERSCPLSDPVLPATRFRLGWLRELRADWLAAASGYDRVLDCEPLDASLRADATFRAAFCLERAGQPEQAIDRYRRVLSLDPEEPLRCDASFRLAFCLESLERKPEAISLYQALVDTSPCAESLKFEAAYRLAEVLESTGDIEHARARLRWLTDRPAGVRQDLRRAASERLRLLAPLIERQAR